MPQAKDKLQPSGALLMEIGIGQSDAAASLCQECFPEAGIEVIPDLAGISRVIKVTRPAY